MSVDMAEQRQSKRTDIKATLLIKRDGQPKDAPFEEVTVTSVGLNGAYFYTTEKPEYGLGERIMCTLQVPPQYQRIFPFVRIAGWSRVVRVDEMVMHGQTRYGVAVAFAGDMTTLTHIAA